MFLAKHYSGDQTQKNEMDGAHSTYGEERRGTYNVLLGKPEGKRYVARFRCRFEDNTKMYLKKKKRDWARTGFIWLRIGTVVGSCERGDEPSGSTQCAEFLDSLWNCQFLKKDSASLS